jgi:hypothetical protein
LLIQKFVRISEKHMVFVLKSVERWIFESE